MRQFTVKMSRSHERKNLYAPIIAVQNWMDMMQTLYTFLLPSYVMCLVLINRLSRNKNRLGKQRKQRKQRLRIQNILSEEVQFQTKKIIRCQITKQIYCMYVDEVVTAVLDDDYGVFLVILQTLCWSRIVCEYDFMSLSFSVNCLITIAL